jgi:hypothetical protein
VAFAVFIDDDNVMTQPIGLEDTIQRKEVQPNGGFGEPEWTATDLDLSKYAGKTVRVRPYQSLMAGEIPAAAYWKTARLE